MSHNLTGQDYAMSGEGDILYDPDRNRKDRAWSDYYDWVDGSC